MSPRGTPLTQAGCASLAAGPGAVIVCGRFEGVDERVIEARGSRKSRSATTCCPAAKSPPWCCSTPWCGCSPACMGNRKPRRRRELRERAARIPAIHPAAELCEGRDIPAVLTSGDHARIGRWRRAEAERLTRERRPTSGAPIRRAKSLKPAVEKPSPVVPRLGVHEPLPGCFGRRPCWRPPKRRNDPEMTPKPQCSCHPDGDNLRLCRRSSPDPHKPEEHRAQARLSPWRCRRRLSINLIQQLKKEQVAKLSVGKTIPDFAPGDTLRVNVKIVEGRRARAGL